MRSVDQLRLSNEERVKRASTLPTSASQFSDLTDEQVRAQWGGQSELNLPTSGELTYLGEVTGLKRGDRVHLTRTVSLSQRELGELLETRLYTSHFLYVFNYDARLLNGIYESTGGRSTQDLIDHNIGMGGSAIPTPAWTRLREP